MSLKAELETWAAALSAYDAEDFEKSLDLFSRIADSSKILTNMGLIYATLGEHEAAVEKFIGATQLDQYLAVAYFQCGVSNFLLGNYELALRDFDEALLYLRGNQAINYEQLGLKFRLFSAEVLFNKGLSQVYLGRIQQGLSDMEEARKEKATDEHNVIDEAIQEQGQGYTVFSIPVGVLYRPSEKKLKNAVTKDYMGKAKLVAAADSNDAYTTFTGVTRLRQGITPTGTFVEDGPNLNRSQTAPPPTTGPVSEPQPPRAANLGRSMTTINVPTNAREITRPRASPVDSRPPPASSGPQASSRTRSPQPPPSQPAPLARGLSLNRRPQGPPSPAALAPPPPASQEPKNRLTEFYDSYLDDYTDPAPIPPVPSNASANGPDRIAAWARSNANPNNPPQRAPSRNAYSNYAPSSFGTGSMRRKPTRRGTVRAASRYEEEEEGYGSGEYEDGPYELVKIRVKLHYQDDVRGMALTPDIPFDEFIYKVASKFGRAPNTIALKFKDEDGVKITLQDESDYELAIETAREASKGKPEGKLEIWCVDI